MSLTQSSGSRLDFRSPGADSDLPSPRPPSISCKSRRYLRRLVRQPGQPQAAARVGLGVADAAEGQPPGQQGSPGTTPLSRTDISASGTIVWLTGYGLVKVFKVVAPDG